MKIFTTPIDGLISFQPKIHKDHRGFFMETWRDEWQEILNFPRPFVQDNHACSTQKGVLRGLHFQTGEAAQSKLVWVSKGSVYDVAVDIRQGSATFGQWYGIKLSAENSMRFYIPRGFAHGYITLEPNTEFLYKVDSYYTPKNEGGIIWNDPTLAITWPAIKPILSEKDTMLPPFSHIALR